jgi:Holliday junction resolvase
MGRQSRDKGARAERELVRLLQDGGMAAEKVSGMYKPGPDVSVPFRGKKDLRVEVKIRATGFSQLYEWLKDRDALAIRQNGRKWLVVVPIELAIEGAK